VPHSGSAIMPPMQTDQAFAPICRALRDEIVEHYRARGERIDDDAGLRTLDTNSVLVPQRGRLLLELVARCSGRDSIEGLAVGDIGCGFGAMSLYFAHLGARVVGVDPNLERFAVGARVAERLSLPASFRRGWAEELPFEDSSLDLVVFNNSFCYVTDRSDRRRALEHAFRACRPGAWVAMRNPSVAAPLDPFTGLPFVHQLPQPLSRPVLRLTSRGRNRSRVRMMSAGAARRELRRAGFEEVQIERPPAERRPVRYQHLTARRPADESVPKA
jgi:SAM-dependent methyltransferase